jgi:hypothetical protein
MALQDSNFKRDVLSRLQAIEERIGLTQTAVPTSGCTQEPEGENDGRDASPESESDGLETLWEAVAVLQRSAPNNVPPVVWRKGTVKDLWSS